MPGVVSGRVCTVHLSLALNRRCSAAPGRLWRPVIAPGVVQRQSGRRLGQPLSAPASDSAASVQFTAPPPQSTAPSTPTALKLWYGLRGVGFSLTALIIASGLFTVMLLLAPVVFIFDRHRRMLYSHINTLWARITAWCFFRVHVEGKENLPSETDAAVYVANHQSFLVTLSPQLAEIELCVFISKSGIFLFPFIGWSMFLTGHVLLNRMDRRSQIKCLKDCQAMLEKDVPVIFFPEGTRSGDKKIQPFKKGAFSIAVRTGVPIVPITINGTGDLMPKGKEYEMHHGSIRVTVHPRLDSKDRDAAELCQQAQTIIASSLPV